MPRKLPVLGIALLLALFFHWASAPCSRAFDRHTPIVEAVQKSGRAVVNIRTEKIVKRRSVPFFGFSDPFFEEFFRDFSPPRTYKTQSLGSGVIIDKRGYILTNAHVIEKASNIYVALPDAKQDIEAVLVGQAEQLDIAVIKIKEGKEYAFLPPARSDDLMIGETVIAIGNPLGLGHSVTTGVVSAARRRIVMDDKMISYFIQTDALINPGNSGGPLLNINGELIGINTAIARQAQGIGFAIPIDVVRRVLPDLIRLGRVRRPYFGIMPEQINRKPANGWEEGGVLVAAVDEKSPADAAGLRYGDVLQKIDGLPVEAPEDFLSIMETYVPGNTIRLQLLRGFRSIETQLVLGEIPPGYGLAYGEKVFGFKVKGQAGGVVVSEVAKNSTAASIGIQAGDRIGEVAGEEVRSLKEYTDIMEEHLGETPLRFLILRNRRGYYVELP